MKRMSQKLQLSSTHGKMCNFNCSETNKLNKEMSLFARKLAKSLKRKVAVGPAEGKRRVPGQWATLVGGKLINKPL